MKSKISIDLDYQNNPIIKIEYIESADVRDKMVKRFLEGFRSESCWALFKYDSSFESTGLSDWDSKATLAVIKPIHPSNIEQEVSKMKEVLEWYAKPVKTDSAS